ncbi:alpha/beta hydrolase [Glutamicibacter halophytocola]|uniref:Alpha/beta hydrolase n=1 Tax=Glutamicibacter halophytocola TaxID=1933880 RepID=A0ABX5Y991_9MICC|nr:alpha/beta hydrolase [Glutamicibacter halophytocola]QDY66238.1 alpha/beta hydrolase [Glutamicibacter halophytocola]
MPSCYAEAPTSFVSANGVRFAYRELGPRGGIPVVFFVHLAANLDNWDPRIIEAIAQHRHVIAFDQRGIGASSGRVAGTIEAAADDAYEFIRALGYGQIDAFAFSMGGFIVQDLIVKHPKLVRKLVLTGTGPRGGRNIDRVAAVTWLDILRSAMARADPKEFLFFERNQAGKRAAKDFIQRINERTSHRDSKVGLKALRTQLKAIERYGRSAPSNLSVFTGTALIANGDRDRMVPSILSVDLHQRIKGSELVIYPDSGHGGVFQYWEKFAPRAAEFLAG